MDGKYSSKLSTIIQAAFATFCHILLSIRYAAKGSTTTTY